MIQLGVWHREPGDTDPINVDMSNQPQGQGVDGLYAAQTISSAVNNWVVSAVGAGLGGTIGITTTTDQTGFFVPGRKFRVVASTDNDGVFTVASSSFAGGVTTVTVAATETVGATADGRAQITRTVRGSELAGSELICGTLAVVGGDVGGKDLTSLVVQIPLTGGTHNTEVAITFRVTWSGGDVIAYTALVKVRRKQR